MRESKKVFKIKDMVNKRKTLFSIYLQEEKADPSTQIIKDQENGTITFKSSENKIVFINQDQNEIRKIKMEFKKLIEEKDQQLKLLERAIDLAQQKFYKESHQRKQAEEKITELQKIKQAERLKNEQLSRLIAKSKQESSNAEEELQISQLHKKMEVQSKRQNQERKKLLFEIQIWKKNNQLLTQKIVKLQVQQKIKEQQFKEEQSMFLLDKDKIAEQ